MSVVVKICGLTSAEAVSAVVESGADIAGFVFAESPRRVLVDQALKLAEGLPEEIPSVAVMRHPPAEAVDEVVNGFVPGFLQTDIGDFEEISLSGPTRPLPVLRSDRSPPIMLPRLLLFEGPDSGKGQVSDWDLAAKLARQTKLVLAGGLNPDNVGDAIRRVGPYGVDVSSGVESTPGVKDPELIARFVAAAREAQSGVETLDIGVEEGETG